MSRSEICPVPNGMLMVIGGHESKDVDLENNEILEAFVKLAGGSNAMIEVITTASNDGLGSFAPYAEVFKALGVKSLGHIHHDKRYDALSDILTDRIESATGVFFAGGDQLKLTAIYGGTPLLTQLKQQYINTNVIVAGTSAGAMALSTPMIYAGSGEDQLMVGNVKITTGLEFLKDVCVDTHFVYRGRFVRMAQVVATNPTSIGVGVEEDTAMIIRNGKDAEVIGGGVVIIIEGFNITNSDITSFEERQPVFIDDLTVRILSKGNKYQIPQINPPHY